MKYILVLLTTIFLVGAHAEEAKDSWAIGYAKSVELAKNEGKDLVLIFVDKEGCPWSEKFENEVMSHPSFYTLLQKDFVLTKIEHSKQSTESSVIEDKFHVEEFPLIILLTSNQEEIARRGYIPFSAEEWALELKALSTQYYDLLGALSSEHFSSEKGEKIKELYEKAKIMPQFKQQILSIGLASSEKLFFTIEKYADLLAQAKRKSPEVLAIKKKICSLDPKNQCFSQYKLAVIDFHTNVQRAKKKEDPRKTAFPLLDYIEHFGKKDREHLWQIHLLLAQFFFSKELFVLAKEHVSKIKDTAPEQVQIDLQETLRELSVKG